MLRSALLVFGLLPGPLAASVIEVVHLFQPLSMHATDGAVENEEEGEVLQAGVMSRPFAISGAIPEDLVKAIALPCKIASNNPAYAVEDANLLNICKIAITTELKGEKLIVRLNVENFVIPEEIDLSARQILKLCITAVKRTVKAYYPGGGDDPIEVSIGILGTDETNAELKDLATRFKAGE